MFNYATLSLVICGSILLSKVCWYFIIDFLNDMPSQRKRRIDSNTKDYVQAFEQIMPQFIEMVSSMFEDEEES